MPVQESHESGEDEEEPEDGENLKDEEDALIEDARSYAKEQGVGLQEAIRRLELQDDVGELDAELAEKEPGTFAGLYVEHDPEWRVVARFTEGGEEKVRPYVEGEPLEAEVEVEPADSTLEELKETQEGAIDATKRLGVRADSNVDVVNNRVELRTTPDKIPGQARLDAALQTENVERPDEVETVEVEELPQPKAFNTGGFRLYDYWEGIECTTGFTMYIPSQAAYGTSTAAHCKDDLWRWSSGWYYLPLKYYAPRGAYYGPYDVQIHSTPRLTDYAYVWDGSRYRPIWYKRYWSNQYVGMYVCKYGTVTGYGCGYIGGKYYDPWYVPSGTASYIWVYSSYYALTREGDSGGPYFYGNTAMGILSGGSYSGGYSYAYYTAPDYIEDFGAYIVLAG